MHTTRRRRSRSGIVIGELALIAALAVAVVWLMKAHGGPAALPELILATPEPLYIEYGTGAGLEIDSGGFISPGTKNNFDLVAFVIQAWEHQWGYVWGTFGYEMTERAFDYKVEQYPDVMEEYGDIVREKWMGCRTADCMGLIKAYAWYDPDTGDIGYAVNGMPDCGTEELFADAWEKGTIDTIPELPGVIVYCEGHVGIYIGEGFIIEAKSTEEGVVKTKLHQRPFTHWLKCPYIEYP